MYIYIKICTHNPNPLSSIAPEARLLPMGTLPARAGAEEEMSWSVTKSEF